MQKVPPLETTGLLLQPPQQNSDYNFKLQLHKAKSNAKEKGQVWVETVENFQIHELIVQCSLAGELPHFKTGVWAQRI